MKGAKMRKIITVMAVVFAFFIFAIPVLAAADNTTDGYSVVDWNKKGSIYIDYKDTAEGNDPIAGAEFTFYKVASLSDSGGYISLIDGIEAFDEDDNMKTVLKKVKKAYSKDSDIQVYKVTTNAEGKANIQNVELGLYIAEESSPADEHFASIPFYVAVPYTDENMWIYTVTANPKSRPGGDLVISKTVTGEKGDKDREWHFKVQLTEGNGNEYTDIVTYVKSDGTKSTVQSGDMITLKHNESATLKCIPVGTKYTVTEVEADKDGYVTSSTGSSGLIMRKSICTAAFTNRTEVDTGDNYAIYIEGGIIVAFLIAMAFLIRKKTKNNMEDADEK